jgi:signal transduction histidine kinase
MWTRAKEESSGHAIEHVELTLQPEQSRSQKELEQRPAEPAHTLAAANRDLALEQAERQQTEDNFTKLYFQLVSNDEARQLALAKELHDGPMQELHGATYMLADLAVGLDETQRARLAAVSTRVEAVNQSLRQLTKQLRLPALVNFGLIAAIRGYIKHMQVAYPMPHIHLVLPAAELPMEQAVTHALYRIGQQALNNVQQHAQARNVWVQLEYHRDQNGPSDGLAVTLAIQDDGKGFEVLDEWLPLAIDGHLGLIGMQERARAIGGELTIESCLDGGTTARIIVLGVSYG